jgi:hypothetical protein
MGNSRSSRIEQLLGEKDLISSDGFKRMHGDTFSVFAKTLKKKLSENCGDEVFTGACGEKLKDWDFVVQSEEQEALIFESLHRSLLEFLFGFKGFGTKVWNYIYTSTVTGAEFLNNFDTFLLENIHQEVCSIASDFFVSVPIANCLTLM